MNRILITVAVLLGQVAVADPPPSLAYINTTFENASPLYWEADEQGAANVFLMYDHERASPNRAAGHWHFRVEAPNGTEQTLILYNLQNIWNGRKGSPASDKTISYVSTDGKTWKAVEMELLEGNRLKVDLQMDSETMYVARLEPYRISDLEKLLGDIREHPAVKIVEIGRTAEGRPLELIRVGDESAPNSILIRARAHPWEPGGNWVVQGLIRRLVRDDEKSKAYLERYCVYVMPMANKDGVARGWTRFNVRGCDLNRKWDQKADPVNAPENHALETWIETMIATGNSFARCSTGYSQESDPPRCTE